LSYENEFLPGNIGIQDVILALKWVQREIIGFNGDSTKITLFGHDSGAIIANLLMAANLEDTSQLSKFSKYFVL
jgi:carboxylesterase type B